MPGTRYLHTELITTCGHCSVARICNWRYFIRPPDVKFYPWTFFSFLLCQSTALSSRAVDGHQMYFEGSFVGKASTIDIGISPTPPLNFTGGRKVRNLASFSTSLNFEKGLAWLGRPQVAMHSQLTRFLVL